MKRAILSFGVAAALAGAVWASPEQAEWAQWSDANQIQYQHTLHERATSALSEGVASSWWQKASMLALMENAPETTALWWALSEQALLSNDFRMLRAMAILAPPEATQAERNRTDASDTATALQQRQRDLLAAWQQREPSNLAPALMAGKPLSAWQLSEYLHHDTGAFDLAASLRASYPAGLALPRLPGEAYADADLVWVSAVGHGAALSTNVQGCGIRDTVIDESDPNRCLEMGRVLAYGGSTISDVAVGVAILESWHTAQSDPGVPDDLQQQKLAYYQLMERFDYSADEDAVLLGQWQELTARHGEWGAIQHLQAHCPQSVSFNQCMQEEVIL